jgi:hypothetical protein
MQIPPLKNKNINISWQGNPKKGKSSYIIIPKDYTQSNGFDLLTPFDPTYIIVDKDNMTIKLKRSKNVAKR